MSDERPSFSRCSVGGNKWFLGNVFEFWGDLRQSSERAVDASGYAKAAVEAEKQARASIVAKYSGCNNPEQLPNYFASGSIAVKRFDGVPAEQDQDSERQRG